MDARGVDVIEFDGICFRIGDERMDEHRNEASEGAKEPIR